MRRRRRNSEQLVIYLPHSFWRWHIPREFRRLHGRKARQAWEDARFIWSRRSLPFALGTAVDPWLHNLNQRIKHELYGRGGSVPLRSAVSKELRAKLKTARHWALVMTVFEWTLGNYDGGLQPLARIANAQFFAALGWQENAKTYKALRALLNELVRMGVLGRIRSQGKVASIYWLKPVQERLLAEIDRSLRPVGQDNGAELYDDLEALAADAEARYRRRRPQPIYGRRIGVAVAAKRRR